LTVLEVIQRSTDFLAKKGVDSPRLQAELLLAHVLNLRRMQLYLHFDRTLAPAEIEQCRELVQQRGRHEPLQYLTGTVCFCGLALAVTPDVLIPRPETELLAERAWGYLNQLVSDGTVAPLVLDFGTGSGCLAIAVAVHCPTARVEALDISERALEVAARNATRHRVAERIHFSHGSGAAALPGETRFDLLLSNPPYIPTAEIETLAPEVREHEPRSALDGGVDGLNFYRTLAEHGRPLLKPAGRLMVECGDGQTEPVRRLLENQKWIVEEIVQDYTQRPRIVIAHQ
jgi:release factor glutamine methyltransferase